jgi:hypothetical protein
MYKGVVDKAAFQLRQKATFSKVLATVRLEVKDNLPG